MLGQKLFQRGGRALTLTRAGHHVLSYAKEIFSLGQDLMSSVKQQPTARPLRLHLGVADALPKLVTYRIIEPIFRLPNRCNFPAGKPKSPTSSSNWPRIGWTSCWRMNRPPVA